LKALLVLDSKVSRDAWALLSSRDLRDKKSQMLKLLEVTKDLFE